LQLLAPNIVSGAATVSFFATTPEAAALLAPLLPGFAAGLPASARLDIR
jgi:hypothetical protein